MGEVNHSNLINKTL